MSSSLPSDDGTAPEQRDAFDFAEAAGTLVQLQSQLREMEAAHETAKEAGELASKLEQASIHISSAGDQLQKTTEDLAEACQEISQQPTVSPKALKKIADELNRLKKTVDAADLNRSQPKPPRRSGNDSSDSYGLIIGVLVLLSVVIGLQVLVWSSLPAPPETTTPEPTSTDKSTEITALNQVDVQVLNGVGESGLAASMKSYLKDRGISVAHVGNAPVGRFDQTTIFVHQNAPEPAAKIASQLGLSSKQIRPGPTIESGPDLTVMIGADYDSLSAYTPEREQ